MSPEETARNYLAANAAESGADVIIAVLLDELEKARLERDAANALLRDLQKWASQRCPCNNDEPRICPLCGADVTIDRCGAVDVSFPRDLRARIAKHLEGTQ
jgi:hypothetical protein